jgi:Protein of unknown function (DUF1573)
LGYTAQLHNCYNKDIVISEVKPSCGCTVIDLARGTIVPANKEIPVRIRFSLNNRYGPIYSLIYIMGTVVDEKTTVKTMIEIKANSMMPALIEPQSTTLKTYYSGESLPVGSVKIMHGNSEKYQWDDVQIKAPKLTITNKIIEEDQVAFQFTPHLDSHVLGSFNDSLLIYLLKDGKRIDYKPLVCNIIWEVINANLVKSPSMIYLGAVYPGERSAGHIIVRSIDHSAITNKTVSISNPDVADVISRQIGNDMIEIDYKLKNSLYRGPISCFIENQISLNGSLYHLRTPLLGYVSDK